MNRRASLWSPGFHRWLLGLGGVAVAFAVAAPYQGGAAWLGGALLVLAYVLVLLFQGRAELASPGVVWPMAVTTGRGVLLAILNGFCLAPPSSTVAPWLPSLLYGLAVLADGLDGALARRLGKTTEVGARLDVALDALGLLVAPVYGVRTGQLPPWYLLLSLAYYAFWGAVALRAELGLRCERAALCPSQHCRMYAGMQMAFVAVALWPGADARANTVVASIIVWPLLVAFWRDWLVVTGVVSVQSAGYQRVIRALVHHSRVTLPWLVRVLWLVWLVYLHLPSWQWPSLPGAALGVALLWGGLAARGAGLLVALTATLAPNALATMNLGPHAWVVGAGVCLVMFCRGKSACGPLWSYLGR